MVMQPAPESLYRGVHHSDSAPRGVSRHARSVVPCDAMGRHSAKKVRKFKAKQEQAMNAPTALAAASARADEEHWLVIGLIIG